MPDELRCFPSYARGPRRRRLWRQRVSREFQAFLARRGLRLTGQRKAILGFLLEAHDHLGFDGIYQALRSRRRGVGRATVFRTLKLLEACGLASRVNGPDGLGRYELKHDRPHHDHLVCVRCGRIIEFESRAMERFQDEAVRRHGFTALWHRHEIFGRCRTCAVRGGGGARGASRWQRQHP